MKINITITENELKNTIKTVCVDPCADIECTGINCDICPLQVVAEECRRVQDSFISVLKSFSIEE